MRNVSIAVLMLAMPALSGTIRECSLSQTRTVFDTGELDFYAEDQGEFCGLNDGQLTPGASEPFGLFSLDFFFSGHPPLNHVDDVSYYGRSGLTGLLNGPGSFAQFDFFVRWSYAGVGGPSPLELFIENGIVPLTITDSDVICFDGGLYCAGDTWYRSSLIPISSGMPLDWQAQIILQGAFTAWDAYGDQQFNQVVEIQQIRYLQDAPEPRTWGMFAAGLIALGIVRRKWKFRARRRIRADRS